MSENSIEFSLSNSEQKDSWLNSGHWTLDADIPLPGVIPSLLLTKLLVASLLAFQGGLDASNRGYLILWYAPTHLHLQQNLWNFMAQIPLLFLILTTTQTRSTLPFLFLLLCFKLHLLLLTITLLTISQLRLSNNYRRTLIEDQHQSLPNQRPTFQIPLMVLTLISLIIFYFSVDSISVPTLCNFPLMKKKSILQ